MAASVLPASNAYNDLRVKYHSVSGGSALSQSMKYAEAWLYGSLSVRMSASRPALLDRDGRIVSAPACRCRSARPVDSGCWQRPESATSPPPTSGYCAATVGVQATPPSQSCDLAAAARQPLTDPYDAVRRSRLAGALTPSRRLARAKSHSPSDRHDAARRKSILDCDLNAYDLLRRTGAAEPAGYASFSDEDERRVAPAATAPATGAGRRKKRQRKLTFGYKSRTKIKEAGEKLSSMLSPSHSKNEEQEANFVDDVSIAGQKIRIFNAFDRSCRGADDAADDWISDPNDEMCAAAEPQPQEVEVTLAKNDSHEAASDDFVDAYPRIDYGFPDRGE